MTVVTNVPTELLRTLVAVVDLRSFTKAAQPFGITQPAVSAQIKRLQTLLGTDLLDKSAPGVSLTAKGEAVVSEARRMLSINDRLVKLTVTEPSSLRLRVGLPGDHVGQLLWRPLELFRKRWPHVRLHVHAATTSQLVHELEQGDLDVVAVLSGIKPVDHARFHWLEEMVWVRAPETRLDPTSPIPLVSHGRHCLIHQHVMAALEKEGLDHDLVFSGSNLASLTSAVAAGFGIMAIPRGLVAAEGGNVVVWEDAPLPRIPPMTVSVRIRSDAEEPLAQLAAAFADALMPPSAIVVPDDDVLFGDFAPRFGAAGGRGG
ncbi:LysR family transcriptional regulator [Xanthobacteraceae bacterium Astr-EGSB]|uniref:LysR family transcriptional regulator n=1 Tax=Astrobacterium formosum TaxID=3069710 RepID=UPI0027B7AC52|nr:LysR family transcriptional regulator [Xanthobacteraceae bacterium Astr-EGSB]